jgi:hypothetical protein
MLTRLIDGVGKYAVAIIVVGVVYGSECAEGLSLPGGGWGWFAQIC